MAGFTRPVPAEILVYTRQEWQALLEVGGRFARTLEREARWVGYNVLTRAPCQPRRRRAHLKQKWRSGIAAKL